MSINISLFTRDLVTQLCDNAIINKDSTPVIGAMCGQIGLHQVGEIKFRTLLLQRVQKDFLGN